MKRHKQGTRVSDWCFLTDVVVYIMSGEAESYCIGAVNLMLQLMRSGGYSTDTVYNKVQKSLRRGCPSSSSSRDTYRQTRRGPILEDNTVVVIVLEVVRVTKQYY